MTAMTTTKRRNDIPTRRPMTVNTTVHMIQCVNRAQYAVSAICLMMRVMMIIV